jgi:hypothetical protein
MVWGIRCLGSELNYRLGLIALAPEQRTLVWPQGADHLPGAHKRIKKGDY